MGLAAAGRVRPPRPADGSDAWRAGPLDADDLAWLRELAACFPAAAHALAIPGSRPMRLRSPESLIRDLWDAIADTLPRTAAAPAAVASPAFAAAGQAAIADLAEWLSDTADGLAAGARLVSTIPFEDVVDISGSTLDPAEEAFCGGGIVPGTGANRNEWVAIPDLMKLGKILVATAQEFCS